MSDKTGFEKTKWGEAEFAKNFLDKAEGIIQDRKRLIEVAISFSSHFVKNERPRFMDLGCGDGVLTEALLKKYGDCEAVLVDASPDMLSAAKERLKDFSNVSFIHSTFEGMMKEGLLGGTFDLAVSSLAIHHMETAEKHALYAHLYERLNDNGLFVNIDTVLSPTDELEKWYLDVWSEWMEKNGTRDEAFQDVPKHYKENPGNTPDTLAEQLGVLGAIGFTDVDCFFKNGIFSVFGGRKRG